MDGLLGDLGGLVRDHWWWLLPTLILLGAGGGALLVAGVSNSLIQTTLIKVAIGAVVGAATGGGIYAGLARLGHGHQAGNAMQPFHHRLLEIDPGPDGLVCHLRDGPGSSRPLDLDPRAPSWPSDLMALANSDQRRLLIACHPDLPAALIAHLESQAASLGILALARDTAAANPPVQALEGATPALP